MKYLIVFMMPFLIYAGSMTRTFTFSPYEITAFRIGDYDLISIGNDLYTSEIGKPALPELNFNVLLPPTAEITRVSVVDFKMRDLIGTYNIFPAQPALPLSFIEEKGKFVPPDYETYHSENPYPGRLVSFTPTGCMSGFRIGGISIYPLQYIPATKNLQLYTEITVRIEYEEGRYGMISLSKGQVDFFGGDVRNLVINPEDIERFSPGVKPLFRDSTDYLIITGASYVSSLQPVANWRTKKGFYTKILPTDSANRYPGRDQQEKIRNLIIDYWQNKGTKWVLLAGDVGVVPYRPCRVINGGYTGDIPCDLYYADLQWSYDGNRNNIFGEFPFNGDTTDLYYDVYIGRACFDNATELATFIRKDTVYEKRPDPNYMVRMFLPQGNLWSGWPGDSTQNMIARYPPVPPWVIRKAYETQGQISQSVCTETLRTGIGLCHMVGHGNTGGVYYSGGAYATSSSVYNLTNTGKYTFANSIACDAGAFDVSDCFSENFVLAPNGGAVADIYNARYGWGYSSGPAGPSELFDMRFYSNFFQSDTTNFEVGKVNCLSKQGLRNSAYNQPVYRWCYYELNLLGDPELPIWSRTPLTLTVTHPSSIGRGPQNFTVTVRSAGNPLQRALVCLWKGDEVYACGSTDASGSVTLSINPRTAGQMSVTVTAKSHLPYESFATVGIEEQRPDLTSARYLRLIQNPVNDRIVIDYSLPAEEQIAVKIFDVDGRYSGTIAQGKFFGKGRIIYQAIDLAGGVYFIRFETKGQTQIQKLIITR